MTFVTRWDPFREMNSLQQNLDRLFQANSDYARGNDELMTTGSFVPAVDIYEDEHSINLKMEVPGIEQKDIDIRMENNTLTVRGERRFEATEKEENFHRIERRYGSFSRSFSLPNTVDAEKVSADYVNGILQVRLAKRVEAKPKQIKVNVGGGQKQVQSSGQAA